MRTLVISDCHGQPHLIKNALKDSGYEIGVDRLIHAGDIIDVGDQGLECIALLIKNEAELLWGNHDAAVPLNKAIWPQNVYDTETRDKIVSISSMFTMAAHVDEFPKHKVHNILITHAGISTDYYFQNIDPLIKMINSHLYTEDFPSTSTCLAHYLNTRKLRDLWEDNSPLWYRPKPDDLPYKSIVQVVGHTPPAWIEKSVGKLENFYVIDPYSKEGFGGDRFRYVIIEDGKIKLVDSND
jgi:hypothetical protein